MLKDNISRLLFFRPEKDSILAGFAEAEDLLIRGGADAPSTDTVLELFSRLVAFSQELGIDGNLWQNYLVYFMLTDENSYSLSRERVSCRKDSFSVLAEGDFEILKELMAYDFKAFASVVSENFIKEILNFSDLAPASAFAGRGGEIVRENLGLLKDQTSCADFKNVLDKHYEKRGTGVYAFTDAFRISEDKDGHAVLVPIKQTDKVSFEDLVGYRQQKEELIRNTEAFIDCKPANNVLLYGDSGAGKSTNVKALVNEYSDRGLRIIEIYKHQFKYISEVLSTIKDRNFRFILYIDDLSFEEFEIEYKYLKAVIEGDMEVKSDNVLIYATSNRTHLIKESVRDKDDMVHDEDIHRSDTIEEKTSLYTRFGVTIYFPSPSRLEYHEIVDTLATRAGITLDRAVLFRMADTWDIRHGGVSCRTARQFIDYMASDEANKQ